MLRYFDGDLTSQEADELDRLIVKSPTAAKAMARLAIDQANFGPVSGRLSANNEAATAAEKEDTSTADDLKFALQHTTARPEADELLQYLLRLERAAPLITVTDQQQKPKVIADELDVDALSAKQIVDLIPYMLLILARARAVKWAGAAAAAVVLLVSVFWLSTIGDEGPATALNVGQQPEQPEQPNNQPIIPAATLTAEHEALWQAASGVSMPAVGENLLPGQRLTLAEGLAEITTARGVKVTLEAPCEIELSEHENVLRLVSGQLYAVVPSPATGFAVQTPTAHIIDIGTEFGVEVREDMATRLQVYSGEVQAAPIDSSGAVGDWVSYYSAQAVSIHPETGVQEIAFDPGRHEHDITIIAMRPQPQLGKMWWRGDVSKYKQTGREKSGAIQVFLERAGVVLDKETPVDLDWPGKWLPGDGGSQSASVQAGKRVDVYLVHFDPEGSDGFDQEREFTIRFKGKILGVICDSESLAQAPDSLRSQTRYPEFDKCNNGPGLDLKFGDHVRIHPNKGSLQMKLVAATCYDQMLVLVESKEIPKATHAP